MTAKSHEVRAALPLSVTDSTRSADVCVLTPGERPAVRCDDANTLSVNLGGGGAGGSGGADARTFRFEAVLHPGVSQAEVMTKCGVRHLLDAVLSGFTATVLAYGQTGSGKTFTMSGREDADTEALAGELDETGLAADDGLILRSLAYLYARMAQQQQQGGPEGGAPKFRVKASYLEIYNEAVFDLLEPEDSGEQLQVRWDGTAFHVPSARRVACDSLDDALQVIAVGARNRRVGSHELNKDSSRSHALCSLYVESKRPGVPGVTQGKVSFVDLAGSERLKASKSAGIMQTETGSINRSLMALGKVISALSEHGGRAGAGHVPYRDSKLTKLLMDSLGGSSLALMVACCSPSSAAVEETLSTLTYATRAKNIVNAPIVHSAPGSGGGGGGGGPDAEALRRELEAVKAENAALRAALASAGAAGLVDGGEGDPFGGSALASGALTSYLLPGVGTRPQPRLLSLPGQGGLADGGESDHSGVSSQGGRSPLRGGLDGDRHPTPEEAALLATLSKDQLVARLDDVRTALASVSVAAAQATAENEALRSARNELQAEHAAAAAQAAALAAKLHDLEAVFMSSESDSFPPAVRARMSSIMSSGPPVGMLGGPSSRAILAHAVGEDTAQGQAGGSSDNSDGELEEEAYYRARTAPVAAEVHRRQGQARPPTAPLGTEPLGEGQGADGGAAAGADDDDGFDEDVARTATATAPEFDDEPGGVEEGAVVEEEAVALDGGGDGGDTQVAPEEAPDGDAEQPVVQGEADEAGEEVVEEPGEPEPAEPEAPAAQRVSHASMAAEEAVPAETPATPEQSEEAELPSTTERVGTADEAPAKSHESLDA